METVRAVHITLIVSHESPTTRNANKLARVLRDAQLNDPVLKTCAMYEPHPSDFRTNFANIGAPTLDGAAKYYNAASVVGRTFAGTIEALAQSGVDRLIWVTVDGSEPRCWPEYADEVIELAATAGDGAAAFLRERVKRAPLPPIRISTKPRPKALPAKAYPFGSR